MHIPDGYLGPSTYGAFWAAMACAWYVAARRVKKTLRAAQVPLLALGAALSFVVMMFNIPVAGGTTGHATGTTLLAITLGPWAAVIAVSIAVAVQAVLFGDGGITTLGANCFNMAFADAIVSYAVYRLIAGKGPGPSGPYNPPGPSGPYNPAVRHHPDKRTIAASAVAAYAGLNSAALLAAVELGLQTVFYKGADGRPLYCPFPLNVTVPAIMASHLAVFGPVEAAFTALAVAYLGRAYPELLRETRS
ncbi:MAG: cobalt transporter CbiM [Nitrospiraceae bacterium]|nr:cobalt transporter CbiM [Nitrospiraceae bacterium]